MTVNYTTNLSLGQPVTGTESGTWGDDVNNSITSYLDIAIAGGLSVTVTTTDVTLSITQGTSSATNIGSTTAQYAILNVSGAMTAARNLIVPSSSRIYLINNNTTGGFALTVKGSATSGVTLVNGEKAHVFWNGTDYAKMSNASGGAGSFSSITDSGNLTFTGTGNRITGDMSNATIASRVAFQTSTVNGNTNVYAIPNGTSTTSAVVVWNNSDPTNASNLGILALSGESRIQASITGTGTYLPMTFYTSGTEKLRIAADTTGTITIGGTAPRITGDTANATIANRFAFQDSTANSQTIFSVFPNGTGTTSQIQLYNGTDTTNYARFNIFTSSASISFSQTVGGTGTYLPMAFSAGGSEAMRIAVAAGGIRAVGIGYTALTGVGDNGLAVLGNVGIGTSSPGAKLDVSSSTSNIIVSRSTGGYSAFQRFAPSGQQAYDFYTINSVEVARITGDPNFLAFSTGSSATERMRIDSSGNVGVGTITTAGNTLRYFDVQNTDTGASAGAIMRLITSNVAASGTTSVDSIKYKTGGFYINNNDTDAAVFTAFYVGASERMRIDSSGNVGIGTSSPQQPLHVYSSAAAGKYIYAQQAGSYNIGFQAQNSVSNWYAYTAASTGNFEFFQGSGSGNVVVVSPVGLGYGTGSGGTVTQATSKSTAVTLNKPTGQITMNNAALLPATSVIFLLSNSLLAATDSIIVQPNYGANSQSYTAEVTFSGAGGAYIRVTNISGGSLSEAVTLSFAIIKGATS